MIGMQAQAKEEDMTQQDNEDDLQISSMNRDGEIISLDNRPSLINEFGEPEGQLSYERFSSIKKKPRGNDLDDSGMFDKEVL